MHEALASLTSNDVDQLEGHYKKFYPWMQLQLRLAEDGMLGPGSADWIRDSAEKKRDVLQRVAQTSINGKMVCHLGPHIPSMLRGDRVAIALMMEDKLLYRYYAEGLKWNRSNQQMAQLLRHFIHKHPRAKILEIGAGTGGATRHIMKVLSRDNAGGFQAAQYHFTDVSAGFFEEAQKEFAEWGDNITYRKLDIEIDPARQGFECGTYDLIIACQVLHATKSMETTMTHVRKLLKPAGKLMLTEITRDQLDLQFVFGLLPGGG